MDWRQERFQGFYGRKLTPDKLKMTMMRIEQVLTGDKHNIEVSSSFDHVISDSSINTVDGFKVVVESVLGSFRYKGLQS